MTSGISWLLYDNDCFLHQGDVCNSRLVNHIFNTENIDVIFHLAAKTHVGEQQFTLMLDLYIRLMLCFLKSHALCCLFPQSRHLNLHLLSSGLTSTAPEFCWELPIRPDTSRNVSSTSAPMKCTEPVWTR